MEILEKIIIEKKELENEQKIKRLLCIRVKEKYIVNTIISYKKMLEDLVRCNLCKFEWNKNYLCDICSGSYSEYVCLMCCIMESKMY
jgi:hypothetical protein